MARRSQTTVPSAGLPATNARRFLLVVGEGQVRTFPLGAGQTLVIGRESTCDVALDHPKISRRHARVREGDPVAVDDLGSTNGIRVGQRRVAKGETAEVQLGESFQLGPFVAFVVDAPRAAAAGGPPLAAIPISDPTPRGVPEIVARVAHGMVSILITGETGTGKEVLARTVHELSGRTGPFLAINCAALSESLLESELFGHERGAFTGAATAKPGLLEVAGKGTVLLDEIGDLPLPLQAKLLRALESREVYRLGGVKPVALEARFMAATHRNLLEDVARERFRRDLYFRVNGITLTVLPLRERKSSIPMLAAQLLGNAARAAGVRPPRLGAAALAALAAHDWPGNVRELRTVMERALVVCAADEVGAEHLLLDAASRDDEPAEDSLERLVAAATAHHGNVSAIARALSTSRSQVRRLAERHGVDFARYRD